jgi:hypothetical protein
VAIRTDGTFELGQSEGLRPLASARRGRFIAHVTEAHDFESELTDAGGEQVDGSPAEEEMA